jgi:hypothetical protein
LIISGETAFKCLDKASTKSRISISNGHAGDHVENDILSANQLIEIARQRGFEARLKHLDWKGLQASASKDPVLLLLRNGNTVLVLRNGGDAVEQIVVSDPLYSDGEEILLPRDAIEPAWDGDAVIVRQFSVTKTGKPRFFVCGLAFFTAAAISGLLFFFYPKEAKRSAPSVAPTVQISTADMALGSDRPVTPSDPLITATRAAQTPVKEPDGDRAEQSQFIAAEPNVRALGTIMEIESVEANSGPSAPATDPVSASSFKDVISTESSYPSMSRTETPLLLTRSGIPFSSEAQVRAVRGQTSAPADALSWDDAVPIVTPPNSILASKDGIAKKPPQSHSLTESRAPAIDTPVLVARGDTLFGTGDITSARLFYERAADAGNGQAALRLGESYDPSFLEQAHLRTVRGDAAVAIKWYKRARELGASEADLLLMSIQVK